MNYDIVKALHIIFVVTWFAGLFYIVRLFIYHVEAGQKERSERQILQKQFSLMQRRLWYGITWPSMILTVVFGTWMLVLNTALLKQGFMHVKLTLVGLLVVYHFYCHYVFNTVRSGKSRFTSHGLRMLNEVATLFLVSIVFVVTLKQNTNYFYLSAGMAVLVVVTWAGIIIYRNKRKSKS